MKADSRILILSAYESKLSKLVMIKGGFYWGSLSMSNILNRICYQVILFYLSRELTSMRLNMFMIGLNFAFYSVIA